MFEKGCGRLKTSPIYRCKRHNENSSGAFRGKMSRKAENAPPDKQKQSIKRYIVRQSYLKSTGNML